MPEKSPLIRLRNIEKIYKQDHLIIPAIRGINLTVEEGEFIALMGPSGSGKSTLMNLLAFLDAPTSGTYEFVGHNIRDFHDDYLAELRNATIGFVFQQFHLLPKTNALENVRLPLMYAGVKRNEQKMRAEEALQRVGLSDRLYHTPNQLSGGQQQRVSLARALINHPRIIFADEPTGNLDSKTSKEIMELLKQLHESGNTLVMVTHEADVASYAHRRIHLKDGRIVS